MKIFALLFLALMIAFANLRFIVPTRGLDLSVPGFYKTLSHVYVGFLFGGGFLSVAWSFAVWRNVKSWGWLDPHVAEGAIVLGLLMGALALLLTGVEITAFLAR